MPRDLRTERHYAIEDFGGCSCSLGLPRCACLVACEKPEPEPPPHFTLADFLMATALVGVCVGTVFAGPMFQGWMA